MAMIFLATSWKLILEPVGDRGVCTTERGALLQPEHAEKPSEQHDQHDQHDQHELTERAQRLNENAREAVGG
jgi:hypothetical protein